MISPKILVIKGILIDVSDINANIIANPLSKFWTVSFFLFSDKRLILNYLFIPMNILIVAILKPSGLGLVIIILVSSAQRTILISLAAILGKSLV
jgi:hypothetical protein